MFFQQLWTIHICYIIVNDKMILVITSGKRSFGNYKQSSRSLEIMSNKYLFTDGKRFLEIMYNTRVFWVVPLTEV